MLNTSLQKAILFVEFVTSKIEETGLERNSTYFKRIRTLNSISKLILLPT
jgi:hypothetical protein